MTAFLNALTARFYTLSLRRQEGQTFVEYGLLLAFITLLCIAGVTLVGSRIGGLWDGLAELIPGGGD